jgi:hypothetical protein
MSLTDMEILRIRRAGGVLARGDRESRPMDFLLHLCEAYRIKSWGTSWEIFASTSSYTPASRVVTWIGMIAKKFLRCVSFRLPQTAVVTDSPSKWHDAVLVPRFDLRAPNNGGKDVGDSGDLLTLQTFNIAYDTGIFPRERHRIQLSEYYLILACTGARPAEVVDNEKKKSKDGELFGPKAIGTSTSDDGDESIDDNSRLLEDLTQETVARGRPKALCYEDILLMVTGNRRGCPGDINQVHTSQGGRQ